METIELSQWATKTIERLERVRGELLQQIDDELDQLDTIIDREKNAILSKYYTLEAKIKSSNLIADLETERYIQRCSMFQRQDAINLVVDRRIEEIKEAQHGL